MTIVLQADRREEQYFRPLTQDFFFGIPIKFLTSVELEVL